MKERKPAILALSDGTVFEGLSFGDEGETTGEVVFNTSMTGYQEVLTDPSYKGQIVAMTYTEQGNYGINPEDVESWRPWVEGFIVKEAAGHPSNWRYSKKGGASLEQYLKNKNIAGSFVEKAGKSPGLVGRDLVRDVTCKEPYKWSEGLWTLEGGYSVIATLSGAKGKQSRGGEEGSLSVSPSPP